MVMFNVDTSKIGNKLNPNNPAKIFDVDEDEVNRKLSEILKAEEFSLDEEINTILETDDLDTNEKLFAIFKSGVIEGSIDEIKEFADECEENSKIVVE